MSAATKKLPTGAVPEGHMRDAQGRLVPIELISPIDLTRDALVNELISRAKAMNASLGAFKADVFAQVASFAALSAAQYKATLGGKKGNITLHSFDGRYKLQLAIADNITFDERLQAAKALIDECIHDWSSDSRPEIKVLVNDAFQTDKEGKLNTGRILGLRRLEIDDKRWLQAMKAIGQSVQVVGSKQYVRFYEKINDEGEYAAIVLDLAGA